jgi:hypothetical protein
MILHLIPLLPMCACSLVFRRTLAQLPALSSLLSPRARSRRSMSAARAAAARLPSQGSPLLLVPLRTSTGGGENAIYTGAPMALALRHLSHVQSTVQ